MCRFKFLNNRILIVKFSIRILYVAYVILEGCMANRSTTNSKLCKILRVGLKIPAKTKISLVRSLPGVCYHLGLISFSNLIVFSHDKNGGTSSFDLLLLFRHPC